MYPGFQGTHSKLNKIQSFYTLEVSIFIFKRRNIPEDYRAELSEYVRDNIDHLRSQQEERKNQV